MWVEKLNEGGCHRALRYTCPDVLVVEVEFLNVTLDCLKSK